MIIRLDTSIHQTQGLVPTKLAKYTDEKIKLFQRLKLRTTNFSEIVGVISGYEFKEIEWDGGGFCNPYTQTIGLKPVDSDRYYKLGEDWVESGDYANYVISHELAHTFQNEIDGSLSPKLLSQALLMEHQAESLAYRFHNACFGKAHFSRFDAYFRKTEHVDFLNRQGWFEPDLEYNQGDKIVTVREE